MLLVSHHLLFKTTVDFPKDKVVLRINVAWIKHKKELVKLLSELQHDIYLDYPQGRSKPPRPSLTLSEVIELVHKFPNVKYFAVSNVEDPKKITAIKKKLPAYVEVVPKIETDLGVRNMPEIIKALGTKYVMLDKEDLYIDVKRNAKKFENLITLARNSAKKAKINLLELHGVVFLPYTK